MFTKMQKFQKAFLIFITVLLSASFGVASFCTRWTDPRILNAAGTFTAINRTYSIEEFEQTVDQWRIIHQVAVRVSPKAQAIVEPNISEQQQQRLFYARNPLWDTLFSLHSQVAQIDAQFDQQQNNTFQGNEMLLRWQRIQHYISLAEATKEDIRRPLKKEEIWNRLALIEEAKQQGIQVTQTEVDRLITELATHLGGVQRYNDMLRALRTYHSQFKKMLFDAVLVLKYINFQNAQIKVPLEMAYGDVENTESKYQIQYVGLNKDKFLDTSLEEYQKTRLAFYDEKIKVTPQYFTLPETVQFDYLYASVEKFIPNELDQNELRAYYRQNSSKYPVETELSDGFASNLSQIKEDYRQSVGLEKARSFMEDVRNKLKAAASIFPLAKVGKQYDGLVYGHHEDTNPGEFLSLAKVGNGRAQQELFQNTFPGQLSNVFDSGSNGVFFLQLIKKTPSRQITREEVENNDELFLEKYYEDNRSTIRAEDRYRLAYVMTNYDNISNNLILTTKLLQDFYEKHKNSLYKIENAGEESAPQYRPFAEIRSDVEKRAANYYRIEEVAKIQIAHKNCQKLDKDVDIASVVRELGLAVMKASGGLEYIEQKELQSLLEIRQNNPTGDNSFSPNITSETHVSEVQDSSKGKYFFIVLEKKSEEKNEFSFLRNRVKDAFLKSQALTKAEKEVQLFKEEYEKLYNATKTKIESLYKASSEGKIESEKQKQEELDALSLNLMKGLAQKWAFTYRYDAHYKKLKELKPLSENISLTFTLRELNPGEVSNPLKDENSGQVFLAQVLGKRLPKVSDVSLTSLIQAQESLIRKQSRELLQNKLTNHKELVDNLGLKKEIEGEDEE